MDAERLGAEERDALGGSRLLQRAIEGRQRQSFAHGELQRDGVVDGQVSLARERHQRPVAQRWNDRRRQALEIAQEVGGFARGAPAASLADYERIANLEEEEARRQGLGHLQLFGRHQHSRVVRFSERKSGDDRCVDHESHQYLWPSWMD